MWGGGGGEGGCPNMKVDDNIGGGGPLKKQKKL